MKSLTHLILSQLGLTSLVLSLAACAATEPSLMSGMDNTSIQRTDHYVPVVSLVPSMVGAVSQVYVREKQDPDRISRNDTDQTVVLFIHGAGTPAEVAFDVPVEGYSWMNYLAERGMDVFSMDMTGYGRSYRPFVMNDRCNLSQQQQEQLFGDACQPSYRFATTSMESDWHDIDTVVEYIKDLRGVDKVHLIGWSQGGPRAGGYAAYHSENVASLVLLAPAYRANYPATKTEVDFSGAALTKQSHDDFVGNWDRQVGCNNQYTQDVSEAVWSEMLASDPVGATWGNGVRRAPRAMTFGWGRDVVAAMETPMLMVAGSHDAQVVPQMVRNLYEDLGSEKKVYLELGCSSHNAMWEMEAETLFDASYQWITETQFNNQQSGMIYP